MLLRRILTFRSLDCFHNIRPLSNTSCLVTKTHRKDYLRMYPTVVVLADGSAINIQYEEPRKIIKLPLDLSSLSDEERKLRLEKRKPKQKVKIEEDIRDEFSSKRYLRLIKKK